MADKELNGSDIDDTGRALATSRALLTQGSNTRGVLLSDFFKAMSGLTEAAVSDTGDDWLMFYTDSGAEVKKIAIGALMSPYATDTGLAASDGAAAIGIADTGTHIDASTVEGALKEIASGGQQTIYVPAGAMEARVTTAPAASNTVEVATTLIPLKTMDYATDADDFAGVGIHMPKSYNGGSLVLQYIWSTTDTGVGGVAWSTRAASFADDDSLTNGSAWGTAVVTHDNRTAASDMQISPESDPITPGGTPAGEEWLFVEVSRDVSDTGDDLTSDARLHGVKIHYTTTANTDD